MKMICLLSVTVVLNILSHFDFDRGDGDCFEDDNVILVAVLLKRQLTLFVRYGLLHKKSRTFVPAENKN